MEIIEQSKVDIFADRLPSMEQLAELVGAVNSTEAGRLKFEQKVQENMADKSAGKNLAVGIGLYILSKYQQAAEKLQNAADCMEKYFYLAFALRRCGNYQDAIKALDKSLKHKADSLKVTLEKACTYRMAGDYDAAQQQLDSCTNYENVSADYHYQLGRLQEALGDYPQAIDSYRAALEISPNHTQALFHLAYRCDLMGDEDLAIDYYKQIASGTPTYVNALLNLAVLYEDAEQYDKACVCVEKVLDDHPNHQRAILFQKDIENSKTMIYDEEKEKRKSQKNKILETPISDFELSVRSRNCLRKMKINTIGDLLNITEAELLSYKNFGETSLREIKAMLETKGLYLGMALEKRPYSPDEKLKPTQQSDGMMNKPIDNLQLSVRARKCLQALNIRTIGELMQTTEAELLGCKNFGVTSLNEIKKSLSNLGLSLRTII